MDGGRDLGVELRMPLPYQEYFSPIPFPGTLGNPSRNIMMFYLQVSRQQFLCTKHLQSAL
jgi:hypothetical protein